ncbi:hypothetical protein MY3296_009989 [Beauveria thailandica]
MKPGARLRGSHTNLALARPWLERSKPVVSLNS